MRQQLIEPPRMFEVGADARITMKHCANIELEPNEQVTFATASGTQYDVARKSWGYYATPSLNGRLRDHGLRAALVVNSAGRLYVMLVEPAHERAFKDYLDQDQQRLLTWLDQDADVERLIAALE